MAAEHERLEADVQRMRELLKLEEEEEDEDADRLTIHIQTALDDPREQSEEEDENEVDDAEGGAYAPEAVVQLREPQEPIRVGDEDEMDEESGEFTSWDICLALNRAYQEIVADHLEQVKMAMAHNRDRQHQLNQKIEEERQGRINEISKRKPFSVYAMPFFKDVNNMNPPPNTETKARKSLIPICQLCQNARSWSAKEKTKLKDAVREETLKQKLRSDMNMKEIQQQKLRLATEEERVQLKQTIEDLEANIRNIKRKKDDELFGNPSDGDKLDWMKISLKAFDAKHTPSNCLQLWRNFAHPCINCKRWTDAEDRDLQALAEKHQDCNWPLIAKKLGTGRSPFQCLQRYNTKFFNKQNHDKWSAEEDQLLKEIVESCMVGCFIPWLQVAAIMEGRSATECQRRWELLQLAGSKGKFTEEEDKMLVKVLEYYPSQNWDPIAVFLPDRTSVQCRERYLNSLDKNIQFGAWTFAEDVLLLQLVEKYGVGKWMKVSYELPGRTDNMVLQRYRRLMKFKEKSKVDMTQITKEALDLISCSSSLQTINEVDKKAEKLRQHQKDMKARLANKQMLLAITPGDSRPKLTPQTIPKKLEMKPETAVNPTKQTKDMRDLVRKLAVKHLKQQQSESKYLQKKKGGDDLGLSGLFRLGKPRNKKESILKSLSKAIQTRLEKHKPEERATLMELLEQDQGPGQQLSLTTKVIQKLPQHLQQQVHLACQGKSTGQLPQLATAITRSLMGKQRTQGKPTKHEKDIAVEKELCKILHPSFTLKRARGRPRKVFAADDVDADDADDKKKREDKIRSVLCCALNVDMDGCALNLHSLQKDNEAGDTAGTSDSQEKPAPRSRRQPVRVPGIEAFRKLEMEEDLGFIQSHQAKNFPPPPGTRVRLHPAAKHIKEECTVGKLVPNRYHIPLLPPSITSVNAFKKLLLTVKDLLKLARNNTNVQEFYAERQSKIKYKVQVVSGADGQKSLEVTAEKPQVVALNQNQNTPAQGFPGYVPRNSRGRQRISSKVVTHTVTLPSSPKANTKISAADTVKVKGEGNVSASTSSLPTSSSNESVTNTPKCSVAQENTDNRVTVSVPANVQQLSSNQTASSRSEASGGQPLDVTDIPCELKQLVNTSSVQNTSTQAGVKTSGTEHTNSTSGTETTQSNTAVPQTVSVAAAADQQRPVTVSFAEQEDSGTVHRREHQAPVSQQSHGNTETSATIMPPSKPRINKEDRLRQYVVRERKTHEYRLLKERFRSLFLWPALLSTVPVDKEKPAETSTSASNTQGDQPDQADNADFTASPPKKYRRRKSAMTATKRGRQFARKRKEERAEFQQKMSKIQYQKHQASAEGKDSEKESTGNKQSGCDESDENPKPRSKSRKSKSKTGKTQITSRRSTRRTRSRDDNQDDDAGSPQKRMRNK